MRHVRACASSLLAILVALAVVSPARAASAPQPVVSDAQLIAAAYTGPTTVDIVLPPQAVPVRIQGQLESTAAGRAPASVGVGGRQVLTTGEARAPIDANLTAADATDGVVRVWLELGADDTAQCDDSGIAATLTDIVIWYVGPASAPGSVADYLHGAPATFTVVVPAQADRRTQEAALNASTTFALLYPDQTEVSLSTKAPAVVDPLHRVLRFEPNQGPAGVSLDGGELVVSGQSESFNDSVFGLGGSYRQLLTAPQAGDVAGEPVATSADTVSLASIAPDVISLSALGTVQSSVRVSQSLFIRPAQELTVDLRGVITPVAGGVGRVNVLWDDQLVDSVAMTEDTAFAVQAVIDSTMIRRDSTLTLQLQYLPRSGTCAVGELPARLDIDSRGSTITATTGETLNGFDMLPQALEDTVVVAVGQGQDPTQSLAQLARLLVGLQRMSDSPLRVAMMDWSVFADAEAPGVAAGLTPQEAEELDTPLSLAPFRTVDVDQQQFSAEVAGDFAALQAFRHGERTLLVLGGVGDSGGQAADDIVAMMAEDDIGFAAYTGDVTATEPGGEPFGFEVAVLSSQTEQVESQGPGQLWWLWWTLGLLAVATGVGLLVRRRR